MYTFINLLKNAIFNLSYSVKNDMSREEAMTLLLDEKGAFVYIVEVQHYYDHKNPHTIMLYHQEGTCRG